VAIATTPPRLDSACQPGKPNEPDRRRPADPRRVFAIKLVGFAIKAGFVLLALGIAYWLLAPVLGLPLP
jgi:hypothetical protein